MMPDHSNTTTPSSAIWLESAWPQPIKSGWVSSSRWSSKDQSQRTMTSEPSLISSFRYWVLLLWPLHFQHVILREVGAKYFCLHFALHMPCIILCNWCLQQGLKCFIVTGQEVLALVALHSYEVLDDTSGLGIWCFTKWTNLLFFVCCTFHLGPS